MPPDIPSNNVTCALTQNCTRIDCCVDFSLLNLELHFFFYIDECNYTIGGGIEKKTFSYELLDFNSFWGEYWLTIRIVYFYLIVFFDRCGNDCLPMCLLLGFVVMIILELPKTEQRYAYVTSNF